MGEGEALAEGELDGEDEVVTELEPEDRLDKVAEGEADSVLVTVAVDESEGAVEPELEAVADEVHMLVGDTEADALGVDELLGEKADDNELLALGEALLDTDSKPVPLDEEDCEPEGEAEDDCDMEGGAVCEADDVLVGD